MDDGYDMSRKFSDLDRQLTGIDVNSYEPAYIQLVNILRRQIAAGVYRPGDRLPSETDLCQRYQLSRVTVRRGINILAQTGVVGTSRGRGTFVKPSATMATASFCLQQLQSIFSNEGPPTVKLLEAVIVSADAVIARKLAIAIGDRTIYIRRLLYSNGEPAIYHREYLICDPTRPVVETEMEATSLHGLFDGSDAVGLKRGDLSIEVAVLNEEEMRLLCSPVPAAFRLEHIFYDFDEHPTCWGWFLCRSDRLRFVTTVGLQDKP